MRIVQKFKKIIRYYIDKLRGRLNYDSIDIWAIDIGLIENVCDKEAQENKGLINEILKYNEATAAIKLNVEKGFPGEPEFMAIGHSKVMINRYLFAAKYFCKNMKILDSCSGLGWGAYLVSNYTSKVFAFDCDLEAIRFCRKTWGNKRIKWHVGNALDLSFFKKKKFDCVLAMETLEHFSAQDGSVYIKNLYSLLRKGGILIGSTPMAHTMEYAAEIIQQNPYHLTIYTPGELKIFLNKFFRDVHIVRQWMFVARK